MENKEQTGNSKFISIVNAVVTAFFIIGIIVAFAVSSGEKSEPSDSQEVQQDNVEVPTQADPAVGQPNKQLNLP